MMSSRLKETLTDIIIALLLIGGVIGFARWAFGATFQPFQGGTGISTSTAGSVGQFLQVSTTSPFLGYQFASSPATSVINGVNGPTFTFSIVATTSAANAFTITTSGTNLFLNILKYTSSSDITVSTTGTIVFASHNISQFTNDVPYLTSYTTTTPATPNSTLQYDNSGNFGGATNLTVNTTTGQFKMSGSATDNPGASISTGGQNLATTATDTESFLVYDGGVIHNNANTFYVNCPTVTSTQGCATIAGAATSSSPLNVRVSGALNRGGIKIDGLTTSGQGDSNGSGLSIDTAETNSSTRQWISLSATHGDTSNFITGTNSGTSEFAINASGTYRFYNFISAPFLGTDGSGFVQVVTTSTLKTYTDTFGYSTSTASGNPLTTGSTPTISQAGGSTVLQTFTASTTFQKIGISQITVYAVGAGGASAGQTPGNGGTVTSTVPISAATTYTIHIGVVGGGGAAGGGSVGGGAGGDSTWISSTSTPATSTILVMGAGGGGAGSSNIGGNCPSTSNGNQNALGTGGTGGSNGADSGGNGGIGQGGGGAGREAGGQFACGNGGGYWVTAAGTGISTSTATSSANGFMNISYSAIAGTNYAGTVFAAATSTTSTITFASPNQFVNGESCGVSVNQGTQTSTPIITYNATTSFSVQLNSALSVGQSYNYWCLGY